MDLLGTKILCPYFRCFLNLGSPIKEVPLYVHVVVGSIVTTLSSTDKGSSSFTSVIFYGNEWSLLLFDVLLFAIVDLVSQNFVLAAIITYIIGWVSSV